MKKYGRHYLRRCLSVLLAVVMVCAAAQTLVFAVDLSEDDITPGWKEGSARARYTTSGTLEITFPESTKPDAEYYAQFYDLDAVDEQGDSTRETPVVDGYKLETAAVFADGENTKHFRVTLSRGWITEHKLDMSHRISIAITAVKDDWRSEAIEALVGESLDVPDANYSPDGDDLYASLARFENEYDKELEDEDADNPAPSWRYDRGTDRTGSVDVNGVYVTGAEESYKYPGFDSSQAFRLYLNGEDFAADKERLDIEYKQDHFKFKDATDLWIWVDTTYVEFDKFAIQVHYMDYTGTGKEWLRQDGYDSPVDANDIYKQYSTDVYSTIGYANRTKKAVPVYYLNDDGLWDVRYTNNEGYLEDFGHYRGFLRVPVDYLQNEDVNSEYATLNNERPYTFNIEGIQKDGLFDDVNSLGIFSAEDAWKEYKQKGYVSWWDDKDEENRLDGSKQMNIEHFLSHYFNWDDADAPRSFGVVPLEDIASVGITWSGVSEDSQNKSFYIDQIGFSGKEMSNNTPVEGEENPPMSLDDYAMVPDNKEAVNNLIKKYLPEDPSAVTAADASVIEDLETICDRLDVERPEGLKDARASLDSQLAGTVDIVEYVHQQLNSEKPDIASLYEIYQSFTLGQIHQLGLEDEAKLIEKYNDATLSEWYPGALGDMYYAPFNNFESHYEVGQTALNEYDDYVEDGLDYYKFAHIVDWEGDIDSHKGAWENKENLVAYAWKDYGTSADGLGQRFGYGASTIAQNGFDNSKAVNTDIYRDPIDSNVENYRISVTYQGETAADYTRLEGHSFTGADSFVFYADFTNMSNIRKAWVTIRTANGEVYSHDDGVSGKLTYQFFDLDNPNNGWKKIESNDPDDGCMSGELCGKRGFFKISLDDFGQMGAEETTFDPSQTIKQVKFFVSGNLTDNKRLNDSFTVDMFGFAADGATSGFEQLKKSSTPVKAPQYDKITVDNVVAQLKALFQPATDLNGKPIYLFDYSPDAYKGMLQAYQTLSVTDKQEVNKRISGAYGFTVDQLQLFVKNYDTWGGLSEGKLQLNAQEAVKQRKEVESAFSSSTGTELDTVPVVSILKTYAGYPDYYKYSVQTYWPDRNLNAVFPNYRPDLRVSGLAESDPVQLTLSEDGENYTGTFNLPYVGAVAEGYGIDFTSLPKNVQMYSADDEAAITVPITWGSESVRHGEDRLVGTFKISADQIQHAGEYAASFTFGINKKADTGGKVENPGKYRETDITVYVKLVSQASFTVVIPADVQIPWGHVDPYPTTGLKMEDSFLPNGAQVVVSVTDLDYKMVRDGSEAQIPYTLAEGNNPFAEHTFTTDDTVGLDVTVTKEAWDAAPVIDEYSDTVVFTAEYVEQQ